MQLMKKYCEMLNLLIWEWVSEDLVLKQVNRLSSGSSPQLFASLLKQKENTQTEEI